MNHMIIATMPALTATATRCCLRMQSRRSNLLLRELFFLSSSSASSTTTTTTSSSSLLSSSSSSSSSSSLSSSSYPYSCTLLNSNINSNARYCLHQSRHLTSKPPSSGSGGSNNDKEDREENSRRVDEESSKINSSGKNSNSSSSYSNEVNNNTLRNRINNSSTSSTKNLTRFEQWIAGFNAAISSHPMTSLGVFSVLQNAIFWGLAAVYGFSDQFQVLVGPELGVAYLISKTISRFRQPVNIGIAAVLSKNIPVLSQFKISPLLGIGLAPKAVSPHLSGGGGISKMEKFNAWLEKPLNQYGMSYYIAARSTSLITLTSVTVALKSGVDISSFLNWVGVSETLQAGGTAMGAAAISNIFLTPVLFLVLPKAIHIAAEMLNKNDKNRSKSKSNADNKSNNKDNDQ